MQADPHAHDLELQDRQPSHTSNSSTHSKSYVGVGIESTASSPTRSLGDRPGSCSGKFADEDEKEIDDEESDVVRWDGPDDPENPRNWPAKKKSMVTMESCLISFTVCMSVSLMSPAVPDIAVEFGVGQVMTTLGYSFFVIGWALGPLFFAPLSEVYGRNIIFQPSWFLYICFFVGAALAPDIKTLLICRFIGGLAGAPSVTNNSGTITDMYNADEQGTSIGVLVMITYLGPIVGPICGGYLTQYVNWRWTFWLTVIMAGLLSIWVALVPETHAPTILKRRAKRIAKETGNANLKTYYEVEGGHMSAKNILGAALRRPFELLFGELIVTLVAIYVSLMSGILYLFFGAYPRVFRGIYGMSQGNSGLAFLGLGLGVILSGPTAGLMTKMYLRRKSERGGIPMPEDRLPYAVAAGIITPISMFWFAWSGQEHVHWIVPILAGIPFGWSMLTLFISQFTYLADSYANVAASCFASVFFLRSLFTCAFPLFTPAMYDNLGAQWAGSVLGFLTLACAPIPLLFYKFGPQIRKRSKRTAKGIVDNADR